MMLFKIDLRFDNSTLTLNWQTETSVRQENTVVTTPVHCAVKLNDPFSVHAQVMLKVISFSILNMHELVETWLPEA